jgi:hypothetical protein
MKPDCPNCQNGKCGPHKASSFRRWFDKYRISAIYWGAHILIRKGKR